MTRINLSIPQEDPLITAVRREHDEFHQAWLTGGRRRDITSFSEEFSNIYGSRYGRDRILADKEKVFKLLRTYHVCTDQAFSENIDHVLRCYKIDVRNLFSGEVEPLNRMIRCYKRWTATHVLTLEEDTHDP